MVWTIGAILQFIFTIVIFSIWMHKDKFTIKHINPAIFIPIVGNIIIPIAGVHFANQELLWFFFSIGLILWLIFTTIIFYRIIFHDPLPEKLIPTFFILMAPSAIGFISYIKLTGALDNFARILYYFSVFIFFLLLAQFKQFAKVKFYLSSWAYSFPIAAFTIATFFMYHLQPEYILFKYFTIFNMSLLTLVIIYLVGRTLVAIKNKEICVEED
jgi:tellurite resistance protein